MKDLIRYIKTGVKFGLAFVFGYIAFAIVFALFVLGIWYLF